jgi:glyceraldehyde 3-phosphate dehydrogenase
MAKVAINGMGRIGRTALKIIFDTPELEMVAVNDIAPWDNLAYLLRYDTAYGRWEKSVEWDGESLVVDSHNIKTLQVRDPAQLPWKELGIDIVFESTGLFTKQEDMQKHLDAGAKWVILSAPTKSPEVPTVVHGVNRSDQSVQMVSCGSCTTNSITPVMEFVDRRIGIKKAVMTAMRGYTSTQRLVDLPHKRWRRGRAAAANLVPTTTGAAVSTAKALPQFVGKFDGVAVRVPLPVGSLSDMAVVVDRPTSAEEVNDIFREEAQTERYRGVVGVTDDPIVSSDIIQDPRATIVDLGMTRVVDGDLVKVMAWYDNEWGYASQMIRVALSLIQAS